MPAEDRKANHPPRRGPRLPVHEDDYHQPEPAAELPAGVPAGLIEMDESAGETPDAPVSARRRLRP